MCKHCTTRPTEMLNIGSLYWPPQDRTLPLVVKIARRRRQLIRLLRRITRCLNQ